MTSILGQLALIATWSSVVDYDVVLAVQVAGGRETLTISDPISSDHPAGVSAGLSIDPTTGLLTFDVDSSATGLVVRVGTDAQGNPYLAASDDLTVHPDAPVLQLTVAPSPGAHHNAHGVTT